jgi:hypothetical protein
MVCFFSSYLSETFRRKVLFVFGSDLQLAFNVSLIVVPILRAGARPNSGSDQCDQISQNFRHFKTS